MTPTPEEWREAAKGSHTWNTMIKKHPAPEIVQIETKHLRDTRATMHIIADASIVINSEGMKLKDRHGECGPATPEELAKAVQL